jgi:dynein heavy chain
MWVRAMYTYYFVAKAVAPKREKLRSAQAELEETQKILTDAMNHLRDVEMGVQKLQQTYNACVKKKKDLDFKCKQCENRLIRADKVGVDLVILQDALHDKVLWCTIV